jgi:hypothetical protein
VASEGLWIPGAFATIECFYCSSYYCHFGKYLLNRNYMMLPFGELDRCQDFLFRVVGRDDRIFIRPDSPLKLFTGQFASRDTFAADLEFMGFYEFAKDSLVVVSTPQSIDAEWRFVITDRTVVAGCQYSSAGKIDQHPRYDAAAFDLASTIASSEYQPDPAWVMDICKTADGTYHLLEIGGFSFSDLYACDKNAVVAAVSKVALEQWQQQATQSLNF